VANRAVTHLPQLESICINISELVLLLLLNHILHITPQFIGSNFERKNLVGRRVEYPTEKRDSSRHGDMRDRLYQRFFTVDGPYYYYVSRGFILLFPVLSLPLIL